jgi:hypothetical protein
MMSSLDEPLAGKPIHESDEDEPLNITVIDVSPKKKPEIHE